MMRMSKVGRRAAIAIGAIVIAMALAAGIASASHGGLKARSRSRAKPLVARAHAAIDPSLASAIGAFRETTPLSAADSASLASLQRIMSASSDSSLPASGANLASARPAPISGGSGTAWIAPAGSKVCSFAPLGGEGYGAACSTLAEVQDGDAVRIAAVPSGNTNESVRIVVIVADGQPGPTVIDAQGNRSTIPVAENVAAAVLPGNDSVETANGHVTVLSGFTAKLGS
jgi:hypothetical protein